MEPWVRFELTTLGYRPRVLPIKLPRLKMEHIDGSRTIVSDLPSQNSAIELNVLKLEQDHGIEPWYAHYECAVIPLYESCLITVNSSAYALFAFGLVLMPAIGVIASTVSAF